MDCDTRSCNCGCPQEEIGSLPRTPALLAGALAGLLCGGAALLLMRRPLDTPLPFVPFLAAGGWTVYLAQAAGWLPRGIGLG